MSNWQVGYNWFEKNWRRILVDMHIPDWNTSFLSKLNPECYVQMMETSGATVTMVGANSHTGLCTYPTEVGRMHQGLCGRDFFGEVVKLCHKRGINVVGYYSLIYNNWAHIEHPDWRILPGECRLTGRYGVCCPNSPYRQFAIEQTNEICSGYNLEGIFFDMTFWPSICYCSHCISRYRKETGEEPPRVINWNSPEWVRFQRAREQWLDEFAGIMTAQVRSIHPGITVTHQTSTLLHDWRSAVPLSITEHCDYLAGDFYGETIQQSIVCKLFHNLSTKRPFEFHTSRCLDLTDHVTMKSPERLKTQAFVAPAHGSALMFIDAIDPDGSLNADVCVQIRSIFDQLTIYESELGGELCADVAVYFSNESKFDPAENDTVVTHVKPGTKGIPHWDAVLGACRSLQMAHIPFTIITKRNLQQLDAYQVLILPDVLSMDVEEAESVRRFVSKGGSLYASYRTSLTRVDETKAGDFLLADVFGISAIGETKENLTFFTPVDKFLKDWVAPQEHMIHPNSQVSISLKTAKTLATKTLPYTDPDKGDIFTNSFSSIHSNPPGMAGNEPAIVLNNFGAGHACYSAGALESVRHGINHRVFVNLVLLLLYKPTWFEAQTHDAVEVVLMHQAGRKRMLVSLLMSEPELVGTKVDAHLRIRMPEGTKPSRLLLIPENKTISFSVQEGYVETQLNNIGIFTMLAIEYK